MFSMAKCTRINVVAFLLLLCSLMCSLQGVSALGMDYGQLGDNLLPPQQVASLLRSNNISKARIFDTNPRILTAFVNSDIELIVTEENKMLSSPSFLSTTKSPFWIDAYPYFAYKGNSKEIPLDYVLFSNDGSSAGVTDPSSNLHYDNLLYAQVDAVIYAIKALGFDDIEVKVRETGWPSKGDDDELGVSLENAAIYNGNLLKRQLAKEGTPLKPNLDVYIFALFNENKKSGPTSERNFGLFHPDGTVAYNAGLTGYSSSTTSAPNSTDAGTDAPTPTPNPSEPPSSDTYLTEPPTPTPSEPPSSDTTSTEPSSPPTLTLSEPPTSDAKSTNALSPPTPSLSEPPTSSLPQIPMTYSSGVKTATTMGRWVILIIIFCALIIIFLGVIMWYYCYRSNQAPGVDLV
ncbi:hypothetical protein ACLB2K_033972 [Fragaria x ananassa]